MKRYASRRLVPSKARSQPVAVKSRWPGSWPRVKMRGDIPKGSGPTSMPPHFPPSRIPFEGPFPSLPIVTPDPPRRSTVEKYGGIYFLGLAGLVVVVGLVSWFAAGVWSLRAVWSGIYILH